MSDISVNKWSKTVKLDKLDEIVRFQLLVHCHLAHIKLSPAELESLTLIGVSDKVELKPFCIHLANLGIFASEQSSRNSLSKLQQEKHLIRKSGRSKKIVTLNPELKIVTEGN